VILNTLPTKVSLINDVYSSVVIFLLLLLLLLMLLVPSEEGFGGVEFLSGVFKVPFVFGDFVTECGDELRLVELGLLGFLQGLEGQGKLILQPCNLCCHFPCRLEYNQCQYQS